MTQMHADAAPQGNFMGRFITTCGGMVYPVMNQLSGMRCNAAGDCMSRSDAVARRCPSWRAQVTQLASFMALPRSAAEQQVCRRGVVI